MLEIVCAVLGVLLGVAIVGVGVTVLFVRGTYIAARRDNERADLWRNAAKDLMLFLDTAGYGYVARPEGGATLARIRQSEPPEWLGQRVVGSLSEAFGQNDETATLQDIMAGRVDSKPPLRLIQGDDSDVN